MNYYSYGTVRETPEWFVNEADVLEISSASAAS
jgi:hypothetical protein